ncbi:hypothetical protein LTR84_005689 [Exophiala bonariae]|uniref:Azaphilone pigments biosynthesis cluster protein L N-terminal domain-containing protein n=1 Tax=Exophiala bonariae TaxID=1690606 RepID=A0AAV9N6F9_9EURO|nr:hypothetical protein LTR84_005689 [Exophiala bonariae]
MGDPISLASGVLALTSFALQSTKVLYEVIESFRHHSRTVRELKEELESLEGVLSSLQNLPNDEQIDISALKLPLLRCGEACRGLAVVIEQCTGRSSNGQASFRDWFMLTYRGKDITGFRNVIGAYKSTIAIAIADANLRHTNVTAQLLREYKEMIDNTTMDLQEILEQAETKLGKYTVQDGSPSAEVPNDLNRLSIEEERASIEHCLNVCKDVESHLEAVRAGISISRDDGETSNLLRTRQSQAHLLTSEKLNDCKTGIRFTISELQLRMQDADHRLRRLLDPSRPRVSPSHSDAEELESIRKCLSICEDATEELAKERVNVFEDVHMTDDAHQVIVATMGDLISARNISTGARSKQWLGQMSDASLQQLSKDNRWPVNDAASEHSPENTPTEREPSNTTTDSSRVRLHPRFEGRHGSGRKLG